MSSVDSARCNLANARLISAMENSPDEMARLEPGACVTESKGLYDKMQHTVITPKGKERRVDIECLALKVWRLPQPSFFGFTMEHSWETVSPKTQSPNFLPPP